MSQSDKLSQAHFGSYILREQIGEGGFSVIYRAEHNENNNDCIAIKILRQEFATDKDKIESLSREFDLMGDLDNPHFPKVYDYGDVRERPAFSMALCPGDSLYGMRKANTRFDVVGAWLAMIRAVNIVHQHDIVHNDLKLENALLSNKGHLSLLDFGNARVFEHTSFFSKVFGSKKEKITGTVSYLAPELLKGKRPSKCSDIYALGICAHILFYGSPPFASVSGSEGAKKLINILKNAGIKKIAKRGTIPSDLGTIIDSCCRIDPAGRPADAGELWNRVDNYFKRPSSSKVAQISDDLLPKKKVTELFSNSGD
ncbi:MAG: serine/threonine protein kinase [Planctomycetes bacterium]|nr:serine/threonine protein kinase [Planctomycetota bacterium]